jgi:hypothetical protein
MYFEVKIKFKDTNNLYKEFLVNIFFHGSQIGSTRTNNSTASTSTATTTTTQKIYTNPCVDQNSALCFQYATEARCNDQTYMSNGVPITTYCALTCRTCANPPPKSCKDLISRCRSMLRICKQLQNYNPNPCKLSCNQC